MSEEEPTLEDVRELQRRNMNAWMVYGITVPIVAFAFGVGFGMVQVSPAGSVWGPVGWTLELVAVGVAILMVIVMRMITDPPGPDGAWAANVRTLRDNLLVITVTTVLAAVFLAIQLLLARG